jgi:uncharacterized protein
MFGRFVTWWRTLFRRATPAAASKPCEKCGRPATMFEYRASPGGPGAERHFCKACAQRTIWIPNPAGQGAVEPPAGRAAELPVEVERIIFTGSDQQLLVLREVGGPRRLPFGTGCFEAAAVWWTLKREPSPRPLTHQAWADTVAVLGAVVKSACVVARRGDTYFAELRMLRDGVRATVDVRPSDAMLVALRAGVPFLFAESLFAADSVSEPQPAEPDGAPDTGREMR